MCIRDRLQNEEDFSIKSIFHLNKEFLIEKISDDFEGPEFHFKIGELVEDYYKVYNDCLLYTSRCV